MYIHTQIYAHACLPVYIHTYIHTTHIFMHANMCMHVHIHIYMSAYRYA